MTNQMKGFKLTFLMIQATSRYDIVNFRYRKVNTVINIVYAKIAVTFLFVPFSRKFFRLHKLESHPVSYCYQERLTNTTFKPTKIRLSM